jgi:hypothetical protein
MTEPAPEMAAPTVRFECTFTVDSKFASRITAATIRYVVLTPGRIIQIALPSVIVAVFVTAALNPGGIAAVGVFILALLAFPAMYVLLFLSAYIRARKQVGERLPVGSEYSITMSDDSMRLKDSFVTTDISYKLFKSVRTSTEVVALNPMRGRRPTLLPRELFNSESLAWLTSRVGTAS